MLGYTVLSLDQQATFAFTLYLVGYLILLISFFVAVWPSSAGGNLTDLSVLAGAQPVAWRLYTLATLCALAGLPPFFFFFCKLSVLALLASTGAWGALACLLILLLLGWHGYQAALSRSLISAHANPTAPQKKALKAWWALGVATLSAMLILGFFFFDDFLIFSLWLAS